MTREEFEDTLTQARQFGGYGLDSYFESMRAHDAKQRATIARLEEELEGYAWVISPAMAQAKIDELNAKVDRQSAEIARLRREVALLKADDAERCILIRDMEEEERKNDAEIERLQKQLANGGAA